MQEHVSLQIVNLRSKRETALATDQVHINVQPSFNRAYEAWDDKLKTRLIETILVGRAMNPIWTVQNDDEGTEEVLDGMHRLTTALNYLDNKFALAGAHVSSLTPLELYRGKFFKDLAPMDQARIRNYNFVINKLDSSYKHDSEKLQDMYDILNRSSKMLNEFEYTKPVYEPFYKLIGDFSTAHFLGTALFDSSKNSRGKLETETIKWLALAESRLPEKFSSLNDLSQKWLHDQVGVSRAEVVARIETHGPVWIETLDRIRKTLARYIDDEELLVPLAAAAAVAPTDDAPPTAAEWRRKNAVPVMFILVRTVALIKDQARVNRHVANLTAKFKTNILGVDIQQVLKCDSRNSVFQRLLLEAIDRIVLEEVGDAMQPRCFPKAVIDDKLREQGGMCALCGDKITSTQKYEGDHIKPWIKGGETVRGNLQVVHHKCHKRK
jgi:hypothetical protein